MAIDDLTLTQLILQNVRTHGIIGLRSDGVIVAWAAGAEEITGYSRTEAIGMHFRALFTEADRAASMPETELRVAREAGRAEDSRWHVRKDGTLFWGNGVTVDLKTDGMLAKIFRDETAAKAAEEQRVLLLNELNHRVKNTLATVQSVSDQTLRSAGVELAVRHDLTARFLALSRAHNVLVEENWAGADLETLIHDAVAAHERDPSPFVMAGPSVRLHPSQAVSVSLAFHELATNAVKYGALGVDSGRVEIRWNLAHNGRGERFLTMLWRERDGPAVTPPDRTGFGSKLIRQTFSNEAGSRAEITFDPEGVCCVMVLPLRDRPGMAVEGGPADP